MGRPTTVSLGGRPYRFVVAEAPDGSQVRGSGRSLAEVDQALSSILVRSVGVGATVIAVAALLGVVIARWLTGPLELLTEAAERIADRDRPTSRSPWSARTRRADSPGPSRRCWLPCTSRANVQQQLVQDAGHELRMLLTYMRANVGTSLRHPNLESGARQEVLTSVDAELVELSTLVDELVELAIDVPDAEPQVEVSVDRLVAEAVDRATPTLVTRVRPDPCAPFTAIAAPRLLARAVGNLLDNAAKFSPDDTVDRRAGQPRPADRSRPRSGLRGGRPPAGVRALLPGGGRPQPHRVGIGPRHRAPCR